MAFSIMSGISMNETFLDSIRKEFNGGEQELNTYSPLVLAYIGDAVYEVIIRTLLVDKQNEQVEKLHKKATKYVKAEAQKDIINEIMEELTEDEMAVFKRARNSKQHTTPKNAKIGDYHKATGFEAVVGYLYLKNDMDRLLYLVHKGIELSQIDNL